MRLREALSAIDAADEEGTMGATPPGDERAIVHGHGHGPSSLADDIAGYLQGARQHIGFQPIYVPYWDLIHWQQAAERLQQRLAAQAPLVDAVTRYGAMTEAAQRVVRIYLEYEGPIPHEFLRAINTSMVILEGALRATGKEV